MPSINHPALSRKSFDLFLQTGVKLGWRWVGEMWCWFWCHKKK